MEALGRRVPDLIIGGAPRSGTTLLCEIMSRHPDVFVVRPFIPEPKVCLLDLGSDDSAYLDHYAELFASAPQHACCVEKTSNYWENDEARERLARILPQTRFVFILREPVARAYSNWRWSTQNGLETLPFGEAFDRSDRPSPLPQRQRHARPFDYIPRSQYGRLASAWIDAVGRSRLRFYVFEQVVANPGAWAADVFSYVGVRAFADDFAEVGIVNAARDRSPIDPHLEKELRLRIRPEVLRFAELTGTDISSWGYS
uniref:sulfotransferase family protein n=1 Tax=Bradyrhizobium sp. (strain ORS 278) TaxID=114615 RepID=UPI0012FED764|nr:sulfotransferase [Bradyrhizobium sp. ORS 278]